jgi:NADH-quinone oxidoreductase subunit F
VVTEKCGLIDPEDIYEYIAEGAMPPWAKSLAGRPGKSLGNHEESGLRGRGGAGFSTGKRKWRLPGRPKSEKIVICNADEGDPGAYMDRTILESNPHQVLEGLAICAYSIGARKPFSMSGPNIRWP